MSFFSFLHSFSMNVGMCCWALIGAQGRYRLATSIAVACSILVTLPIAAVTTIGMRLDLQGLTFAVVTGYTVTAMLLSSFLLISGKLLPMTSIYVSYRLTSGDIMHAFLFYQTGKNFHPKSWHGWRLKKSPKVKSVMSNQMHQLTMCSFHRQTKNQLSKRMIRPYGKLLKLGHFMGVNHTGLVAPWRCMHQ